MSAIHIEKLSIAYGTRTVLHDLNLDIKRGQWVALLGRSGCGKSTLIKAIAGLNQGTTRSGTIGFDHDHTHDISYMAQKDALLPWLSIRDNVQLSARLHRTVNAQTTARAQALLSQVGLAEHGDKPPYQLSGGQRQRAALARTLMSDAEIVLMDEPFSAVDAITRLDLQRLASELLHQKTVLLITHDPLEAIRLADTIHIMRDGRIHASFTPEYPRPRLHPEHAQPTLQAQLLEALS